MFFVYIINGAMLGLNAWAISIGGGLFNYIGVGISIGTLFFMVWTKK